MKNDSEEMEYWNITQNGQSFSTVLGMFMDKYTSLMFGSGSGNAEDYKLLSEKVKANLEGNANKWVGNCTGGINCGQGCAPIGQPW